MVGLPQEWGALLWWAAHLNCVPAALPVPSPCLQWLLEAQCCPGSGQDLGRLAHPGSGLGCLTGQLMWHEWGAKERRRCWHCSPAAALGT